ncbi:MAG: hypothetical protein C4523_12230 [Myxococcales bacterium]|nr:MAG: hypothetical protein C4523_12230 [Myxococcales bacterium]
MTDQPQNPSVAGLKITVVSIGRQRHVNVPAGSTCADALTAAGFDAQGYSLTLNGSHCQLHERPSDGDILALTPKVDGGC